MIKGHHSYLPPKTLSIISFGIIGKLPSLSNLVQSLHPALQARVRAFLLAAEDRGIFLRVTSAYRSYAEQARLYAQGRTAPGQIVTNAQPGESYHNFGLAFDVVEIRSGQALWQNPRWREIGELGKSYGFAWGGDWKFKDLPHFQDGLGRSLAEWRALT